MSIEDVNIGDIYYTPNPYHKRNGLKVLAGAIIEINERHKTVLLKGIEPITEGNFGAHVKDIYTSEASAYIASFTI